MPYKTIVDKRNILTMQTVKVACGVGDTTATNGPDELHRIIDIRVRSG